MKGVVASESAKASWAILDGFIILDCWCWDSESFDFTVTTASVRGGSFARALFATRGIIGKASTNESCCYKKNDRFGRFDLNYSSLSVGILFSTGMMSNGVLDLTHTFCSLKNLAEITSQASPIVSTGMRMPLGVVLNSWAALWMRPAVVPDVVVLRDLRDPADDVFLL